MSAAVDAPPAEAETLQQAQFLENTNLKRLLETPRTKEALRRTGLTAEELAIKSYHEFFLPGDYPERQRLRDATYGTTLLRINIYFIILFRKTILSRKKPPDERNVFSWTIFFTPLDRILWA